MKVFDFKMLIITSISPPPPPKMFVLYCRLGFDSEILMIASFSGARNQKNHEVSFKRITSLMIVL